MNHPGSRHTKRPSVSLITVVYNNVTGIDKTISSVLSQTCPAVEFIVIDGGSNDGTVEIIKKYEPHLAYWHSEPDKGIYDAMNKGITHATSEYVMFLNSGDDFFGKDSLEKIVKANNRNYDILYNNLLIIGSDSNTFVKKYPTKLTFDYFTFETIPHPATLIKKSLFETVGLYDDSLKIVSDWKWFLMAIIRFNVRYKHSGLIAANFCLDGISSQKENDYLIFREKARVLEEEFGFQLSSVPERKKKRFSPFSKLVEKYRQYRKPE